MNKNEVVMVLEDIAGEKKVDFIVDIVNNPGLEDCSISDKRGGVYGFAIKLEDNEVDNFFENRDNTNIKRVDWKTIGNRYYPLYWGKDINLGSRLHAHTKSQKDTYSIQLNNREFLKGKEIIFGAILCANKGEIEKRLKRRFPDVLMTKVGKG